MAERTITISDENAEAIDQLVEEGRAASAADVVSAGILALADERSADGSPEFERWLREEVVPVFDKMRADPERGIPIEEVRRSLQERHERRLAKSEKGFERAG